MSYRESIVTFLDILGFRNVVTSRGFDDIENMLDAMSETAAAPVGEAGKKTDVLSFSDSVIRARPTSSKDVFADLLHEVADLAHAQWSLMEYGILVRGGITIGKIAMGPGRAFGPAFVRAYDLESSLAGAPRIVLDPTVVQTIRSEVSRQKGTTAKRELIETLKHNVRLGEDGLWFVDYIGTAARTIGDATEVTAALGRFRSEIIARANAQKADSRELPKYLWLIRYHNRSVKRLFPTNKGLKIKSSDVPAADELLKPKRKSVAVSTA